MKVTDEMIRILIRLRNPVYGSKAPDPGQNVTDLEQFLYVIEKIISVLDVLYSMCAEGSQNVLIPCLLLQCYYLQFQKFLFDAGKKNCSAKK
jgi:hypothetical protein